MVLVPYDDADDEPHTTRSTEANESKFSKKIVELENKLKELEKKSVERQRNIVSSVLIHLNEKIENRLNNIHALYSLLFDAIQNFNDDKEVAIPLFTNWLQRGNKVRMMSMASKFHIESLDEL